MICPFQVGDKVKSSYFEAERNLIRSVTAIEPSRKTKSGYFVSLDDGGICHCCKRPFGTKIYRVDLEWIEKA